MLSINLNDISEGRFWNKVNKTLNCWTWTGAITSGGYGCFCIKGHPYSAHRVAYALYHEGIPIDLTVDHLCRNRGCVNPLHLEAVTNKVNILRGIGPTAINAAKTTCLRGHEFDLIRDGRRCSQCRTAAYHHNIEHHRARDKARYQLHKKERSATELARYWRNRDRILAKRKEQRDKRKPDPTCA